MLTTLHKCTFKEGNCCVFWPALGCCAHPKAGQNLFFSHFSTFFVHFRAFSKKNTEISRKMMKPAIYSIQGTHVLFLLDALCCSILCNPCFSRLTKAEQELQQSVVKAEIVNYPQSRINTNNPQTSVKTAVCNLQWNWKLQKINDILNKSKRSRTR